MQTLKAYEKALAHRKRGDAESLLRLLGSEDAHERAEAATALGRLRRSSTADPLADVLRNDEVWQVRREAASALGAMAAHTSATAKALREAVTADPHAHVRMAAMDALRRLPSRDAVEALGARIDADDKVERSQAAMALAALNHRSAVPYLMRALRDPSRMVFGSAWSGLRRLVDDRDAEPLAGVRGDLGLWRRRRVDHLLRAINDRPAAAK
jgi:HEAT repeat protein